MSADQLRAVGFNDEQTHCDRCGKLELRGTVILADEDNLEVGRYGTTCASKLLAESGQKSVTRSDAVKSEYFRRDRVKYYLRQAQAAMNENDPAIAQYHIHSMRRDEIAVPHRPDELAIVAAVDATGIYVSVGYNRTEDEIRAAYARTLHSA